MKRIGSFGLLLVFLAGLLSGCGKELKADCDTVYVQKKGTVVGAVVEQFDKDYYSKDELEKFIDREVEEYQNSHDKNSVKITEFSVKDGKATLFMKYAGQKDYQEFNRVTLFTGTVPQALSAGYDFKGDFYEVKDKKTGDTVKQEEILGSEDKVVVLSEKIDLKVDGTIKYVSSSDVEIKAEDTVALKTPENAQDGAETALVYVIYE